MSIQESLAKVTPIAEQLNRETDEYNKLLLSLEEGLRSAGVTTPVYSDKVIRFSSGGETRDYQLGWDWSFGASKYGFVLLEPGRLDPRCLAATSRDLRCTAAAYLQDLLDTIHDTLVEQVATTQKAQQEVRSLLSAQ